MATIKIGEFSIERDFDISTMDFTSLADQAKDYDVGLGWLKLLETAKNYVTLYGSFSFANPSDYASVVREITSIKKVDGGQTSFTISGLDILRADVATDEAFLSYLEGEVFKLIGNDAANHLVSFLRNDILSGLGGNDILEGLDGSDLLNGGIGVDRLDGGADDDRLIGGTGGDFFLFADGCGIDTIADFKAFGKGRDRIDLTDYSVGSFSDLSITQDGTDVVIDLGGDTIILENVSLAKIDVTDFLF